VHPVEAHAQQQQPSSKHEVERDDDKVGDIDQEGGFGLGKANPDSKPKETY